MARPLIARQAIARGLSTQPRVLLRAAARQLTILLVPTTSTKRCT
jgi:hypothetical protein